MAFDACNETVEVPDIYAIDDEEAMVLHWCEKDPEHDPTVPHRCVCGFGWDSAPEVPC